MTSLIAGDQQRPARPSPASGLSTVDRIFPVPSPARWGNLRKLTPATPKSKRGPAPRRTSNDAVRSLIHCDTTKAGEGGTRIRPAWPHKMETHCRNQIEIFITKCRSFMHTLWVFSGTSGVEYLIEAGKALLTGTRPEIDRDPKVHGKFEL